MPSRFLTLLGLVVALAGISSAQQSACKSVEIPVGVINVSGDVFRGLAAEDFIGRAQRKPVAVKSITYDDGPRRVLFVVDNSSKLSPATRQAEREMIEAMLSAAGQGDTFALQPARGLGREVSFTSERTAITQALGQTSDTSGKDTGALDAVLTGIAQFGALPQDGDSIVVIAVDLEGNHKASPKAVAKALDEHHIRMFGLALGPVATQNAVAGGSVTSASSQGLAWTTPGVGTVSYKTGDDHFYPLTVNSGGLVLGAMNVDRHRSYDISDAHVLESLRQKARSISKMIATFYRVQIEAPPMNHPEEWDLDVNENIRKHTQQMFVLYPHSLGLCQGS